MRLTAAVDDYFVARQPRKDSEHTLSAYRTDLATLTAIISEQTVTPATELTTADLTLHVMRAAFAVYAQPRAKTTVRRCWSTWQGFFNHLVAEGTVEGNPMAGVARPSAPKREPKSFDPADVNRLLDALLGHTAGGRDPWPERDLAIIATLLVTGIRSNELLGLNADHIHGDPGERRLSVRGKGDTDRTVPFEPALETLLDAYLATRRARFPTHFRRNPTAGAPALSTVKRAQPLIVDRHGERMRRGALQYLVRSAYRAAGIDSARSRGALVHALRHTFATRLIENGASAVELMDLLGHRSLATTQHYVRASGREVRAAAASNPIYQQLNQ